MSRLLLKQYATAFEFEWPEREFGMLDRWRDRLMRKYGYTADQHPEGDALHPITHCGSKSSQRCFHLRPGLARPWIILPCAVTGRTVSCKILLATLLLTLPTQR